MAEQQDPEIPDVPEHDLSEEDMMLVSLLYKTFSPICGIYVYEGMCMAIWYSLSS